MEQWYHCELLSDWAGNSLLQGDPNNKHVTKTDQPNQHVPTTVSSLFPSLPFVVSNLNRFVNRFYDCLRRNTVHPDAAPTIPPHITVHTSVRPDRWDGMRVMPDGLHINIREHDSLIIRSIVDSDSSMAPAHQPHMESKIEFSNREDRLHPTAPPILACAS